MQYFGQSANELDPNRMGLRPSDNSEYLCRELLIASHNGLTHLSDVHSYDSICRRRVIRSIAQHVLRPVLPILLHDNDLICHEIAEFIGAHVFLRCATLNVPLECRSRPSVEAPTNGAIQAITLYRSPPQGRADDLQASDHDMIGYASTGLDSEDEISGPQEPSSLSRRQPTVHTVTPVPLRRHRDTPSDGHSLNPNCSSSFNFVSPRPLRLVPRSASASSSPSRAPEDRLLRRGAFPSVSVSPQPSLERSSSSAGHVFASTSMYDFGEGKDGDNDEPGARSWNLQRTRRHRTFVLSDAHGRVLRDDIFSANWEEFDVMFWRGVRMCDVALLVDQDLNLFTRMPHRRMWFTPTSAVIPRSHLCTPYAPLFQFFVRKWHFKSRQCEDAEPASGVSHYYSLCADSQGVSSALSYTLPISTQTTHVHLLGEQVGDSKLFCAIDEPSAVFDADVMESDGDTSFSCSSSDDFHTALVIEELRAVHPSQRNNESEFADEGKEYLYFVDQMDCDNVRVARRCEWKFECSDGEPCEHVFIVCCYDSMQPFLIFSPSFPSVQLARDRIGRCRRVPIPLLVDDEKETSGLSNSMSIAKVKFETLSSANGNDPTVCGASEGTLFVGVQHVNATPDIEPNARSGPVFVPNSTRIVIHKFDNAFNLTHSHIVGHSDVSGQDLSTDIGIVFVLEDMVVTHEFVYVLLSAEAHPHFLGRKVSSNPWMQLPHHDDAMSSSGEEYERHAVMENGGSDEDEEDDCPRFRNVDNRWRVILRAVDLTFVAMEPDRVQFPGALLGSVVPLEMFE